MLLAVSGKQYRGLAILRETVWRARKMRLNGNRTPYLRFSVVKCDVKFVGLITHCHLTA